jgi:methylthioribulose-1-phosphate dehydratase
LGTRTAAADPDDPRALLAATARDLYRRGWMAGTAGNLSLRLADGSFWITASGKPKGALGVEDFLRVAAGGAVLARGNPGDLPSAETCIHQAVYSLFPEAAACYHVHTVASNLVPRLPHRPPPPQRPPGRAGISGAGAAGDPEKDEGPAAAAELALPPLEMLKGLGVREERPRVAIAVFPNHLEVPAIAAEVAARFRAAPPRLPAFLIRDHGLTVWAESGPTALNYIELLEFIFAFMIAAAAGGQTPE